MYVSRIHIPYTYNKYKYIFHVVISRHADPDPYHDDVTLDCQVVPLIVLRNIDKYCL